MFGRGEDVVEVQVFPALLHRLRLAGRRGGAGLDAVFHRFEIGGGEMGHRTSGQFGLEQTPNGINLRYIHLAKEQIVLHELKGTIERLPRQSWPRWRPDRLTWSRCPAPQATSGLGVRCPC